LVYPIKLTFSKERQRSFSSPENNEIVLGSSGTSPFIEQEDNKVVSGPSDTSGTMAEIKIDNQDEVPVLKGQFSHFHYLLEIKTYLEIGVYNLLDKVHKE